ncbi:MAG: hypothetical protein WB660_22010, partial [Candidatus Sulfotelmatobacter sp.]
LRELQQLMGSGSDRSMRAKIQDIVPEYNYELAVKPSRTTKNVLARPHATMMVHSPAAAAND